MNLSRLALRSFLVAAALALALPAQADPKADILAAHAAMMAKGKFRTVNKVTSGGETSTSTNVVQWPDRYHMKTKDMEMIILPEGTWMNQGGQWMKMPMNMAGMVKQLTPDAIKQSYDNMANVQQLADAEVDGEAASVYEYDTSATIMGIKADSHVKLYVAKSSGLIVRQDVDGKAMGVASQTVSTYTYDPDINIQAPN